MIFSLFLVLLFLSAPTAWAKPTNVTVDDNDLVAPTSRETVIRYSVDGSNQWRSSLERCAGCTANPGTENPFNGTWHDGTYTPSISGDRPLHAALSFNGTAVYVYFILPLQGISSTFPDGHISCTFTIDGVLAGNYTHNPPRSSGYLFDQVVFSAQNLPNGPHEIVIRNDAQDGKTSLILLDRIVYTMDDEKASESEVDAVAGLSAGATAGIVAGAVLFSVAVGCIIFWSIWRRRKRPLTAKLPGAVEAQMIDTTSRNGMQPFWVGLPSQQPSTISDYPTKHGSPGSSLVTVDLPPPAYGYGSDTDGTSTLGSRFSLRLTEERYNY